jgi:hypothetical protein
MTAALAVISAALALGPLPERGFVLETKAGVQLQSLGGRPLGTLPGMNLAMDQALAHKAALRDRQGRVFVLDRRGLRARQVRRGCRTTDQLLTVCPRKIIGPTGVLARAPGKVGHWVWAERSPSGKAILAQWSAECEVPIAYLLEEGELHAFGRESVALGWLRRTGEAVIHFPNGPCAGDSRPVRGIYSAVSTFKMHLILRTRRFAQYLMWGG